MVLSIVLKVVSVEKSYDAVKRGCLEVEVISDIPSVKVKQKQDNLHQRGQFLRRVRVPEVDPPAGAAEGGGGEQRPVGREVAGRQKVQGLVGSSCQVPDERVRAQTPQTDHLKTWR